MQANDLISLLDLKPLPGEGGYFRRTHEGTIDKNGRAKFSVIYYLLTPEQPRSALHYLPIAESYHFYLGDPVQMLILQPDGSGKELLLGSDVFVGQKVQTMVPEQCWHGSYLCDGGKFALLGTTMTPGYVDSDYQAADCDLLQQQYPAFSQQIKKLTGSL
ncbi:MAG: cupin domain-containing protein [Robiginitomaculum sp.]|nr:cupin domain-containing protein [Robiginitomaculum sp.]